MTVLMKITVKCDWPGCERHLISEAPGKWGARVKAQADGWAPTVGLDFCPLHPLHAAVLHQGGQRLVLSAVPVVDGVRLSCTTCGWADEADEPTVQDSQDRWIAHLPKLLSDAEARTLRYPLVDVVFDGDVIHRAERQFGNRVKTLCGLTGRPTGRDGGTWCPDCTTLAEA